MNLKFEFKFGTILEFYVWILYYISFSSIPTFLCRYSLHFHCHIYPFMFMYVSTMYMCLVCGTGKLFRGFILEEQWFFLSQQPLLVYRSSGMCGAMWAIKSSITLANDFLKNYLCENTTLFPFLAVAPIRSLPFSLKFMLSYCHIIHKCVIYYIVIEHNTHTHEFS